MFSLVYNHLKMRMFSLSFDVRVHHVALMFLQWLRTDFLFIFLSCHKMHHFKVRYHNLPSLSISSELKNPNRQNKHSVCSHPKCVWGGPSGWPVDVFKYHTESLDLDFVIWSFFTLFKKKNSITFCQSSHQLQSLTVTDLHFSLTWGWNETCEQVFRQNTKAFNTHYSMIPPLQNQRNGKHIVRKPIWSRPLVLLLLFHMLTHTFSRAALSCLCNPRAAAASVADTQALFSNTTHRITCSRLPVRHTLTQWLASCPYPDPVSNRRTLRLSWANSKTLKSVWVDSRQPR